jgi:hypothetical protein
MMASLIQKLTAMSCSKLLQIQLRCRKQFSWLLLQSLSGFVQMMGCHIDMSLRFCHYPFAGILATSVFELRVKQTICWRGANRVKAYAFENESSFREENESSIGPNPFFWP